MPIKMYMIVTICLQLEIHYTQFQALILGNHTTCPSTLLQVTSLCSTLSQSVLPGTSELVHSPNPHTIPKTAVSRNPSDFY